MMEDQQPKITEMSKTRLKNILGAIPSRDNSPEEEFAAAGMDMATKRAEARRDAVVAVALAIARRGDDPVSGWKTTDIDTAWAISDQLIALNHTD